MTRSNTIVQNSASIPENCQNRSHPTAMFDTARFFDLEGSDKKATPADVAVSNFCQHTTTLSNRSAPIAIFDTTCFFDLEGSVLSGLG